MRRSSSISACAGYPPPRGKMLPHLPNDLPRVGLLRKLKEATSSGHLVFDTTNAKFVQHSHGRRSRLRQFSFHPLAEIHRHLVLFDNRVRFQPLDVACGHSIFLCRGRYISEQRAWLLDFENIVNEFEREQFRMRTAGTVTVGGVILGEEKDLC